MDTFQLYRDINGRTNGEIYLGVVGPVRTGKSTFIKRFMDLLVLPNMKEEQKKEQTKDELPQSASGTAIMTTEPKFIPKEEVEVQLCKDICVKVRLIDCVGFMVKGASGHRDKDQERKVKTPWFDHEIPFTKAAAIGTEKVIHNHATIGIVVTTDGTIGAIPRENYEDAEKKTIEELQAIGKPFVVLLNSTKPYAEETRRLKEALEMKYQATVVPMNCEKMEVEDIHRMMQQILFEFPISEVGFFVPKWVELLENEHQIKQALMKTVGQVMEQLSDVRSVVNMQPISENIYLEAIQVEQIDMQTGKVRIQIHFAQKYYYQVLGELTGTLIHGEYELLSLLQELTKMKREYVQIRDAFADVQRKGYGAVCPKREEIKLEEPILIRQGNKYGVKLHAKAPSIHMIRAEIETEIAPIVGNEQQAQDLVDFLHAESQTEEGVWATNIFGKSVETLVMEGIQKKMDQITDESQEKLQDSMQKIVNDSNGGLICFII